MTDQPPASHQVHFNALSPLVRQHLVMMLTAADGPDGPAVSQRQNGGITLFWLTVAILL